MSTFRRRLTARANKLVLGIDFSRQPDNELWYITTDGQKVDNTDINLMGNWNRQEGLQVISHTYENGIGKVQYSADVVKYGESTFRIVNNCLLVSVPKKVSLISAFSFGNSIYNQIDYLVFLRGAEVDYNTQFEPKVKKALYVQPNCAQYYKDNFPNIEVIERAI